MAIDARAKVLCNLGEVVSASISDDYIQGSGLIKTTGSCVIDGLITPVLGDIVTFTYERKTSNGAFVKRTIPRKMRVLSSFADPYRRTTSIQLGCKLTYLSNLKEALTWTAFDDPLNEDVDPEDQEIVTIPISASSIAAQCKTALGIGGATPALGNKFSVASFDFSGGYVAILSDLMVSENLYGFLDFNENLIVRSLNAFPSTVPVITNSKVIDVSEINSGEVPGESVVVSYNTLRLKDPEPASEDETAAKKASWEYEETTGSIEYTVISAKGQNDEVVERYFSNIPRTETVTTYDKWDRMVKRVVSDPGTRGAFLFGSYCTDLLSFALSKNEQDKASIALNIAGGLYPSTTTTVVKYKLAARGEKPEEGYDEVDTETTTKTGWSLEVLSSCGPNWINNQGDFYIPGNASITTEVVETTYEKGTKFISIKPSSAYAFKDVASQATGSFFTDVSKSVTTKRMCYGLTSWGQAAIAKRSEQGVPAPESFSGATNLVGAGIESRLNSGREIALQSRPSTADLINADRNDNGDPNNGYSTPSTAQLALAYGSISGTANRIELSMPYAPDDTFTKFGSGTSAYFKATRSSADSNARAFGRIQNSLLLGNRYGMNIQTLPEYIPSDPYAPFVLEASGYQAVYRVNGLTWTMDANGVVAATDGLFVAGIGGTGNAWFPVAPGVVIPPTTPPTSNNAPVQYLGSLPNVNAG